MSIEVCPYCDGPIGTGSNHEVDRCQDIQISRLWAEIERLRAALAFYANPVVYVDDSVPDRFAMQTWPVMRDGGKRARNALEVAPTDETTGGTREP